MKGGDSSVRHHPHPPSAESSVTWAGSRTEVVMGLAHARVGVHLAC